VRLSRVEALRGALRHVTGQKLYGSGSDVKSRLRRPHRGSHTMNRTLHPINSDTEAGCRAALKAAESFFDL